MIFAGHVITGGVVSRTTVTVNVQVALFPKASVAVQVTVVVPTGNGDPDAGTQMTLGGAWPQRLCAVAWKLTTAVSLQVVTVWFGGQATCTHNSANTVTVKLHVLLFPHRSVAVQLTVVTPAGNTLPDGGTQTIVVAGSVLSVAVVL